MTEEKPKQDSRRAPRIGGRVFPDGRMEVFHGRMRERVVPEDGTDRSGIAPAIRRLQRRLERRRG
jgi:hypothetical protein